MGQMSGAGEEGELRTGDGVDDFLQMLCRDAHVQLAANNEGADSHRLRVPKKVQSAHHFRAHRPRGGKIHRRSHQALEQPCPGRA